MTYFVSGKDTGDEEYCYLTEEGFQVAITFQTIDEIDLEVAVNGTTVDYDEWTELRETYWVDAETWNLTGLTVDADHNETDYPDTAALDELAATLAVLEPYA